MAAAAVVRRACARVPPSWRRVRRICLAFGRPPDTSVILRWLSERYDAEIVASARTWARRRSCTASREGARTGAADCVIDDLREEFARDFVFPMLRGAIYETNYLLGTSIARAADREAPGRGRAQAARRRARRHGQG